MANKKILVIGGVAATALISYALWKMQEDNKSTTTTKFQTSSDSNSVVSETTATTNLPSFSIKNAYWSGSQFLSYSSLDDTLDKNLDETFINRTATIYALNMTNGTKAYLDVSGTVVYPSGLYYYETTGQMLQVAADGTMTFTSDVTKPTNLSATTITESYN